MEFRLRVAVWEAASPARGVCVLLDGQTEFLEKYQEVASELNARGFTVAALDWRGQGASQRLLDDSLKVHVADFRDYDADLGTLFDAVVAPLTQQPVFALAHSMGAHILLRALHARPGRFAAAVAIAPMLRVLTRGVLPFVARSVCYAQCAFGRQDDYVWGMAGRDPLALAFADNLVTSDETRYARNRAFLEAQREIRLAGPTWGWLEAAYRAMADMAAPGFAEAIATPVLMVGAGRDRIVDTAAVRAFASRLQHGTYLEIGDAQHEILMENDAIRARFWAAFDAFVARNI